MKALPILILVGAAGFTRAAFVIDDFNSGEFHHSISQGSWVASQSGTMLGGERDFGVVLLSNTLQQSAHFAVESGHLVGNGDVLVDYNFFLDYDGIGDEIDPEAPFERGPGLGSRDLTALGDRFQFDVLGTDQTYLWGRIQVFDGANAETSFSFAYGWWEPHEAPFSQFVGDKSILSRADRIVLSVFMGASGDIAMDNFVIVPEPGTMAAFGLPIVGWALRKRRRRLGG